MGKERAGPPFDGLQGDGIGKSSNFAGKFFAFRTVEEEDVLLRRLCQCH